MSGSLFEAVGDGVWLPTERSIGPWSRKALHGGPVAALLARAAEQVASGTPEPLQPVRLTLELLRPAPVAPMTVTASIIRPGRKVQLVGAEAAIDVDGKHKVVARAAMLRLRTDDVPVPGGMPEVIPPPPEQGVGDAAWSDDDPTAFHNAGVEHAFVLGHFRRPGPSTDWIRLQVPVVPGEEPSPFQRVAAAADFGNGISGIVDPSQTTFVNPDLTVYLHRLPIGEWICLEATTHAAPHGIGLAESALYDARGRIGRSVQSLLFDRA